MKRIAIHMLAFSLYIHVHILLFYVQPLSLSGRWIDLVANSLFGNSHGPDLASVRADVCRLGGTATRHVAVKRGSRTSFFGCCEPFLKNLFLREEILSVLREDAQAERRWKVLVKEGVGLYSW